jgi:hypothetical protein
VPNHENGGLPPVTPADYGHDELFSFSNVTNIDVFDAIRGIKFVAVMELDGLLIRFFG